MLALLRDTNLPMFAQVGVFSSDSAAAHQSFWFTIRLSFIMKTLSFALPKN
jgi:hypothetical protein